MGVRWGRVAAAVVGVVTGPPVVVLGGLWSTAPTPQEVPRRHPGAEDCRTIDRLGPVWEHPPAAGEEGPDPVAARAFLEAARCRSQEEVPTEHVWGTFRAAMGAIAWVREEERDAAAVRDLLDLWELATDAQEVGPVLQVAVWQAVAQTAAEALDGVLADPATTLDAVARAEARTRLVGLARHEPDLRDVPAREERSTWALLGSPWPAAWWVPRYLIEARTGTTPLLARHAAEAGVSRLDAGVLAASLELWEGCPAAPLDVDALQGPGVTLAYDPARCAVAGASGSELRVATPRGARPPE